MPIADPLLVERILRNLTVQRDPLHRRRRRARVRARARQQCCCCRCGTPAWASATADRERVFEEFVQLHEPMRSPIPNQRKGLGLGLAIVRRLSALMSAPLTLRSHRGRGSVFTLEVPQGRPRPAAASRRARARRSGVTLDRRLVVMIEDDPAVKSGLEVLLKSWGASVIGIRQPARLPALGARPPSRRCSMPDLIIADYRLESGHTGIEAIRALRGMLEQADSRPSWSPAACCRAHEREAQEHDFHLLLKPVVPNKLRAMIAFKLGLR